MRSVNSRSSRSSNCSRAPACAPLRGGLRPGSLRATLFGAFAGAISYVEVPDLQKNLKAVTTIMQFIYDHNMYAELNTKSDYCQSCGFDGEIEIVEDANGKLVWRCPKCGNTDQTKMNVVRRTCGYLGSQFWNQGRTAEIKERVLHVD